MVDHIGHVQDGGLSEVVVELIEKVTSYRAND